MTEKLSRRNFIKGAALGAALAGGAASLGLAAGCSPQTTEREDGPAASAPGDIAWDHEVDFVVVGSGTAVFGALAATEQGGSALIIEKDLTIGGTTRLSGCVVWTPLNGIQEAEGYGADLSADEVVAYLKAADLYKGSRDEDKEDYVAHAAAVFSWANENWGLGQTVYVLGDYLDLPGCKAQGRSLIASNSDGDQITGSMNYFTNERGGLYDLVFEPMIAERGIEVLTGTEAKELLRDGAGRVVGIRASDGSKDLFVKGNKGVLLGCGGFDHDEQMRNDFLRGPVVGANSVKTNVGDGHKMGMAIGAALGNMGSMWQLPFYDIGTPDDLPNATDWFEYAGLPGALVVNPRGRRFCDENTAYGAANLAFYAYDSDNYRYLNMPAFLICDQAHVDSYGWPGYASERPEWFAPFESLEELAGACGIDEVALLDEVARFNAFCESGTDEDWGRGGGIYGPIDVESYGIERPELANPCLAPVAAAPYFAAKVGPGTCGTSGGLKTDLDARVLGLDGTAIEGLYACGNNSAGVFGSCYPGAGGTVGAGFYRAFRAANHAMGLGLV
ncbi:MAG: FAD-binding protein [Coriobacteriales bacterium]|nr:FAD-binding protein [Coriobacteriales bacterium]